MKIKIVSTEQLKVLKYWVKNQIYKEAWNNKFAQPLPSADQRIIATEDILILLNAINFKNEIRDVMQTLREKGYHWEEKPQENARVGHILLDKENNLICNEEQFESRLINFLQADTIEEINQVLNKINE